MLRKPTQYVSLYLPPPISTNALTRSVAKGRFVTSITSAEYRKWKVAASQYLELQKPGCVVGPYGLRIAVPKKCRVDLDNTAKALIDLLHQHHVVEGDGPKHLQRLEIWRGEEEETFVQIISTKGVDNGKQGILDTKEN